ncbi:SusC/RagA family TonB-linked outer membrane protein [Zhouia sp. PK063]|uniref:SusC/RagA family TonB-linked outer membrane protein n=1 Tax=Zhouia sp. PK063 TaxID=3373602 RepID=UPI003789FC3B
MKRIITYVLLSLLLLPVHLFSQTQQNLKGTITEDGTNTPLPGVNIVVKGTTKGTITDFDGNYEIVVDKGDVLVFSSIGYSTKEITYTGQASLNLTLAQDVAKLDEVVIVGYGQVKKKDATGAVNQISTEDFNKGPVVTAGELMTGKVAGVTVTSSGGAPGAGQNIIIRGQGSLSLTSSPLYVVDGVPIDNGAIGGSRNPLDFINPNDIESMTVLKDASSTAIYGSRAANGVVLITTKKGKGKLKFNYSGATTVAEPIDYVNVLSANQFRSLIQQVGTDANIALLGEANTNWQKEIYRTSFSHNHNLSASGTIAKFMPFRASVGYSNQDGILKRDNFQRTTASLNLRPYLFDNHLKIELNGRGMYTENVFGNNAAIGSAVDYDPTQSIYDENSPFGGYYTWLTSKNVQNNLAPTNPVALINLSDDTSEIRRFVGNAKFDYNLHFLPDVTATLNLGYDITNSKGRTLTSAEMPSSNLDWDGSLTKYSNQTINRLLDYYMNYNKQFGKHGIDATLGYSYQRFDFYNYSYDSEKEQEGNTYEFINTSRSILMSYFGRASYNFDDKYIVKATFRADASSKLNPDDRWGLFPSVSVAWNMNNENFLKDSKVIDQLKLRIGYGEVGNVNGLGDYNFLTNYTVSESTAYYQFGNAYFATYRPDAYNPDLRWEVGKTFNAGIDYSLFNGKLSGLLNAYLKKTSDLISYVTVDPFTNFSDKINKNIGDMENKGLEFEVNYAPIKTKDFNWKLGYNISYNENKITNLPDEVMTGGINGGTGNTIQIHKEGYAPYSFYVYQQVYDQNGKPIEGAYVDRNNDGQINESDKYIDKSPYAKIQMGFNTNLSYKNFDLSVVTRASLGNYVYNNMASSKSYQNRATENSILTNLSTDYYNTGFKELTEGNLQSDYYVQNASFFKIDNVTLGYTLPELMKNVNMRVYGSVQNVATITDYDGIDPEIYGGIDNNFYPRPRSYVFGVNVDF